MYVCIYIKKKSQSIFGSDLFSNDQALNKSYTYDAKALSIGSFATMMADGTLVNTHLRAARLASGGPAPRYGATDMAVAE